MRLIDADELREQCHTIPDPKGIYCGLDIIEKYEIDDAPTVFEISDNATNGDILMSLYPNLKYIIQNDRVVTTIGVASSFDLDWWNSPYQKGGKE